MSRRVEVCPAADLPPGERVVVEVEGLPHSVGVFNVDGEYHALANVCPHHLAPLCEGTITGEMRSGGVGDFRPEREGEVIRCPWHGWKFDIATGESVFNPHELRTRTYETAVESPEAACDCGRPPDAAAGTADDSDDSDRDAADADPAEVETYGTPLRGDEPPVETYDVDVEAAYVVLYV
jgi:nitrite reductase/ring-hydroxylating ferredoxin subunit